MGVKRAGIPHNYTHVASIHAQNDAYLVAFEDVEEGTIKQDEEHFAYGSFQKARSFVSNRYGRVIWEEGNNAWFAYARSSEYRRDLVARRPKTRAS